MVMTSYLQGIGWNLHVERKLSSIGFELSLQIPMIFWVIFKPVAQIVSSQPFMNSQKLMRHEDLCDKPCTQTSVNKLTNSGIHLKWKM